ncbi:2-dehydropantoate 2-reductase [Trinickia terrae]|uniref:2-dehydropantoate 2-reductase n=1 Tax=Trinickia terrae TaxID=2571161 RepID=A0A4U1HR60_9BURK|nr:2-dehydropantoate 2-reductase [Trinickia terrae]TKC83955.1 2-dehydropantoate 2-reductase [Trinickia terrae]
MKIAVLGAGAMGSLFGGLLAESGQHVTLLDIDEAHLDAIRQAGLRVQTDQGDRRVTNLEVRRPEAPGAEPDLLIVFTKSLHTRGALSALRHLIGPETFVLTLQNGLGNVEALSEFVAPQRILIGVTTWPSDLVAPGHVSSHGEGQIRMMSADGVLRPEVEATARALDAAGLNCEIDPQVWTSIWEKVAFNAALNSLCAVTGCSVDGLGAVADGRALASQIVGEVLAVARTQGVDIDAERCRAKVAHAIANHRGHKPSMLQDMLAGRRTEIEAINGAVVAKAGECGVPVPHTEILLQLVRVAEARRLGEVARSAMPDA